MSQKQILETMQDITAYIGWSDEKILSMHETAGFPLKKIGGRWVTHVDLIERWVLTQINTSVKP